MKYGLPDSAVDAIARVLAKHPQVRRAVLYGSRAMGTCRTGSDIDLALSGGADLTMRIQFRIMDELDDLLLPYTIDLCILHDLTDAEVLDHIRRVGITFYERGEAVTARGAK